LKLILIEYIDLIDRIFKVKFFSITVFVSMLPLNMGSHGTSCRTEIIAVQAGNLHIVVQVFAFNVVLHVCYVHRVETALGTAEFSIMLHIFRANQLIQSLVKVLLLLTFNE